jgi:hypothetical protein
MQRWEDQFTEEPIQRFEYYCDTNPLGSGYGGRAERTDGPAGAAGDGALLYAVAAGGRAECPGEYARVHRQHA